MNIRLENINQNFKNNNIIKDFTIDIKENEYVCIIGKSGCGKTTLLNIISGMLKPTSGNVYIDNKDIFNDLKEKQRTKLRNENIGYLNCGNCLIESLTVLENIKFPLEIYNKKVDIDKINNIIDELEISNIKNSYPSQLSSGEYKRVCFARILMLNTNILILDEPTSNLDDNSANIIINIINKFKNKKTIIIATHDKRLMQEKIINLKSIKI